MTRRTLGIFAALGTLAMTVAGTALAQSGRATATEASPATAETSMTTALATPALSSAESLSPADFAALDPQAFLQQLREREQELDDREQTLANEREALEAVRGEIEARIAELQRVRDEMAQRLETIDRAREERIDALALWSAGMDPSAAAAQLSTQPVDIIVDVLMAMETRAASAVLEQIQPDKAGEVIQEMSRRN